MLPYASVSSPSGRDQKMFQGVSNRCSPHSTDGQTEARKDEATLLQSQSRGWHLGLLTAHLIQVTKARWPSGDAQYWVTVSICGHPNSCPTLTKTRCCCPLLGPPRAGITLQSSAGGRLSLPRDPARIWHAPTLLLLLAASGAPTHQGAGRGGFYSWPCIPSSPVHPITAGFARSGRRWHSRQRSAW